MRSTQRTLIGKQLVGGRIAKCCLPTAVATAWHLTERQPAQPSSTTHIRVCGHADKRHFRIHKITCRESWPAVAARYYYAVGRSARSSDIFPNQTQMTACPAAALVSLSPFFHLEFATFRANLYENVTMKYASESILWYGVFLFVKKKWEMCHNWHTNGAQSPFNGLSYSAVVLKGWKKNNVWVINFNAFPFRAWIGSADLLTSRTTKLKPVDLYQ